MVDKRRSLLEAWERLLAKQQRPDIRPRFADYAWSDFNVGLVVEALTSAEKFRYHHQIVYAALCGWVVAPRSPQIRRRLISIEAANVATTLERRAKRRYQNVDLIAELMVRVAIAPTFFDEVYYPTGGLRRILQTGRARSATSSIKKLIEKNNPKEIIGLLTCYHYHSENLANRRLYYPASMQKAADIVSLLGSSEYGSGRTVKKRWSRFSKSSAFLYAACQIEVDASRTLFDDLKEAKFSFNRHRHILPEWFGRAKFVVEDVLELIKKPKEHSWSSLSETAFPKLAFSCPTIPDVAAAGIRDVFSKRSARPDVR